MDYSNDELVNKDFGIKLNPELTSVVARVLQPPKLKYNKRDGCIKTFTPERGEWESPGKRIFKGGNLKSWACICFSEHCRKCQVDEFTQQLFQAARKMGMVCARIPVLAHHYFGSDRPTDEAIEKRLHKIQSESPRKIQLLFAILPETSGSSYGVIKKVCETKLGIVSQCVQPKNVFGDKNLSFFDSLALKINVKVGGLNNVLEENIANFTRGRQVMIFGADVTHNSKEDKLSPSIAAVVASMDGMTATKYKALFSAQPNKQEIIQDLYTCKDGIHGGLIRQHLISFMNENNYMPSCILFYRDGVGEGKFKTVFDQEVTAIKKACESISTKFKPKITVVLAMKRHHTRFFPAENSDNQGDNILAGTVVDRMVCHATAFDFYLCSHKGLLGISRPVHYHVLYDENLFSADEMQTLTNNLCYTFARCKAAVSLVTPIYYAHLSAERGRYYVESTGSGRDYGVMTELPEIQIHKDVENSMFFV